jgi:hypothetical protein
MQNTDLDNIPMSTEEVLGPPKVDLMGFGLISIVALVTGFLVGILVFLLAFLFLGNFSLQSGASPILLAMITFFATICGNMLYVWGLTSIFPHIYRGSQTLYVQVSIFSIILYVCMAGVYVAVDMMPLDPGAILAVYTAHIIFDVFGLVLITGLLSMYRYSLLVFYSSMASLLASGLIPIFAFTSMGTSSSTLFIFMVFSALAFALTTIVAFGIQAIYYRIYISSGYDPLGDVFGRILAEEQAAEKQAEAKLFSK